MRKGLYYRPKMTALGPSLAGIGIVLGNQRRSQTDAGSRIAPARLADDAFFWQIRQMCSHF